MEHDDVPECENFELVQQDKDSKLFDNLAEDFLDLLEDKDHLIYCIDKFIDNLVDELALGIIFDIHRKYKTKAYCLEIDSSDEDDDDFTKNGECPTTTTKQNNQKFVCPNPNCELLVSSTKFTKHLQSCMGLPDDNTRSTRTASRNLSLVNFNKEKIDSLTYSNIPSEDDDDGDNTDKEWNSRRKDKTKKRRKKKEKNGRKTKAKTTKKPKSFELPEQNNTVVEIDVENFRESVTNEDEFLHGSSNSELMSELNLYQKIEPEEENSSNSPESPKSRRKNPYEKRESRKKKNNRSSVNLFE